MTKILEVKTIIEIEKCFDCDHHEGCICTLAGAHKVIENCEKEGVPPIWCPLPEKENK